MTNPPGPPTQDDLDRFVASLFALVGEAQGEQDAIARLGRLVIALAAGVDDPALLDAAIGQSGQACGA